MELTHLQHADADNQKELHPQLRLHIRFEPKKSFNKILEKARVGRVE